MKTGIKATPQTLPKLCGADLELGNFITGPAAPEESGFQASRLLLRQVDGLESRAPVATTTAFGTNWSWFPAENASDSADDQDWGRRFLRNGGCAYVDLNHLEVCIPETLDAYDHVASVHAMYRLANMARASADRYLPPSQTIHVLANNSDGHGNSYGSHLNLLVTRQAWNSIFRRIQTLGFLASFHAASVVTCGLGKVGSENGTPHADYQCSQRADFLERIQSLTTTVSRGILNTRHEPLCGPWRWLASGPEASMSRLHIICCDHNLCHAASVLKIGGIQLVLAMIEAGSIDGALVLDDPVRAVLDWSHDPSLKATASLISGDKITAVDWQRRFVEAAQRFAARGGFEGLVPRASSILELWSDTLDKLARSRFEDLTGRLDWVLKRAILEQAAAQHQLAWDSPALKHLDHLYSDLDPDKGLYWAYERAGMVERLIPENEIARREFLPPETTRAWTRGALLSLARAGQIETIDWDHIRFCFSQRSGRTRTVDVQLGNPLKFTKPETEHAFAANDLEAALAILTAEEATSVEALSPYFAKSGNTLAVTKVTDPENTYGTKHENSNPDEPSPGESRSA